MPVHDPDLCEPECSNCHCDGDEFCARCSPATEAAKMTDAGVDDDLLALAELIAEQFHEAYEDLAPRYGYKTREASAVPWEDVPEANRRLMTHTVVNLLVDGAIKRGDRL